MMIYMRLYLLYIFTVYISTKLQHVPKLLLNTPTTLHSITVYIVSDTG